MRNSLVVRLVALIALTVLLSFIAVSIVLYHSTSETFVQKQNEELVLRRANQIEKSFGPDLESAYATGSWPAVQAELENKENNDLCRQFKVFVIDEANSVVVSNDQFLLESSVSRTGDHEFRLNGSPADGEVFEIIVNGGIRLYNDSRPIGHLLALPIKIEKEVGNKFAAEVWTTAGVWFFGILTLSITGSVWFMRRSLRPLQKLTAAANQLREGNIPRAIPAQGGTEFRSLICAFNSATETMALTDSIRRQMISDISHELRTPLTNIRSIIEAAEKGLFESEKQTLASMQIETSILERLVGDFQQLALSETGQLQMHLFEVPLACAVENCLSPVADMRSIRLIVKIPEDVTVFADEDRLNQVFNNLMENSIRYRDDKLTVTVTASQHADTATIIFADNGPGIHVVDRPHVFDRLYRAEKSRNRETGGAGLGLAISRSLIEAMNGSIRLLDQSANTSGAQFEIILPTCQNSEGIR